MNADFQLDLAEKVTSLPLSDEDKKRVIDIVFWAMEQVAEPKPPGVKGRQAVVDLDPELAKAMARSALTFAQGFDGRGIDWQGDSTTHIRNLGSALDHITELSAMVLNLADRAPDVNELMARVYLYGAHCAEHPEDATGAAEKLAAIKACAAGVAIPLNDEPRARIAKLRAALWAIETNMDDAGVLREMAHDALEGDDRAS